MGTNVGTTLSNDYSLYRRPAAAAWLAGSMEYFQRAAVAAALPFSVGEVALSGAEAGAGVSQGLAEHRTHGQVQAAYLLIPQVLRMQQRVQPRPP